MKDIPAHVSMYCHGKHNCEVVPMNPGTEIHVRLDDYVRMQEKNSGPGLFGESCFGLSREGSYVDSWHMNYQRIGHFTNTYMVRDFGADSVIQIMVPQTETGTLPSANEPQPFGWTGKINEYATELAVWWAFELLSDEEARRFMAENRPVVLFRYYDDGGYRELETKFNGTVWMLEKIL
jgi:hypothetical protein